ncbi:Gfo/Idh/MocA family protein [Paenibacillus nasutitermitis]|uniref:Oxidoreductase n=1 Tax=Paenibacillus nasutitermitis TaxID=1652958 RepID=A0A917E0A9_9BACL|nr:Gfo/Idh/MocA family oxidoreductase [Paenibacillus nasutitermitis]GGD88438.1 oxidoreductase [Paenibacillus nasutitermitis]
MNGHFSIIGCEHPHIQMFILDMIKLGHTCTGIYEPRNHELAGSISKEFSIPLVTDIEACLGPSVEFVGSAAINNEKIDIIEKCEQRGKHILIDKPAVTDPIGLERLEKVIRREKIQIGMMLTSRFSRSLQSLKDKIESGELGEIVHIAIQKPHRLNPLTRPQWHFSRKQCGSIIIDLLVHDFDLLRWLTGKELKTCQGFAVKRILPEYPDFFDMASIQVLMEGNIVGNLYADWHTPDKSWSWGDSRIFVVGTKGKAEVRQSGDPLVSRDELLLVVSHNKKLESCTLKLVQGNLTEDFIARARGTSSISMISHKDILKASAATIEADRSALYLVES